MRARCSDRTASGSEMWFGARSPTGAAAGHPGLPAGRPHRGPGYAPGCIGPTGSGSLHSLDLHGFFALLAALSGVPHETAHPSHRRAAPPHELSGGFFPGQRLADTLSSTLAMETRRMSPGRTR